MPSWDPARGIIKLWGATDAVFWGRLYFPPGLSPKEKWDYYVEHYANRNKPKNPPENTIIDNEILDPAGNETNIADTIILADGSEEEIFSDEVPLGIRDRVEGQIVFTLELNRDFQL
jgi:hypothetical protein